MYSFWAKLITIIFIMNYKQWKIIQQKFITMEALN